MGEIQQPLPLTRIYRRRGPPLQLAGVGVGVRLRGSNGVRRLRHVRLLVIV
jgi:hypothetical protein